MPDRSGRSMRSTRTWRGRPQEQRLSMTSRWTARVTTTALGLVLMGLLAWVLWWWMFLPRVHVFGLPVANYDALAVPPIPFADEDVARLTAPPPDGPKSNSQHLLAGLETSEGMATLSSTLRGIVTRPRDVAILYLSAHGVSSDGKALLLCSNYSPANESGRIELGEVLRQVSQCRAQVKLVLLDAGWIAGDPRQGMIVNEFPRLLRDEVQKLPDDSLWLLSAHRPLETSHVSYPDQASVFGHCVIEGLTGSADADGDHVVELDEFYAYVRKRVASRVHAQTGGSATQSPELFRGSIGPAEAEVGIALVSVSPTTRDAEPAEQKDAGPAPPAAKQNSPSGTDDRQGQAAPDKSEPVPAAQVAAGPTAVRTQVQALLVEAWSLRDRLQSRADAANWTPVDYAPHLWREFQELLHGYELQFRDRQEFAASERIRDLEMLIASLKLLAEQRPLPNSADPSSVLARLDRARQQVLPSQPPAQSPGTSEIAASYAQAVRLRNDLLFVCPDYLRWYGRIARSAPFAASLHDHLSELLSDQLSDYGDLLAAIAGKVRSGNAARAELDSSLRQIQVRSAELNRLRDRIEKDILAREVQAILDQPKEDRKPEETSQRIVDLLATPILAAPQRAALLTTLEEFRGQTATGDTNLASPSSPAGSQSAWNAVFSQAELAWKSVQLFDPASARLLQEDVDLLRTLSSQQGEIDESKRWESYRRLGGRLAEFYSALPQRIRQACSSTDPATAGPVELLLRAVDARDSVRVPADACRFSIQPLPDFRLPEEQLELTGPERLEIEPALWTEFSVDARVAGARPGSANLSLEYDKDLLAVETLESPAAVASGQQIPVDSETETPKRYSFRVRSAPQKPAWETTTLVIHLASGQMAKTHRVTLAVRPPDTVELQVTGTGLTVDRREGEQGDIRLRPFPNRTTQFQLDLVNRSGKARKVSVVLLGSPPGELPNSDANRQERLSIWQQNGRVLAGPLDMELPADQRPVPIPFPAPEKPAPSGETPAAKSAEETAKPVEPVDITKGLACVVRENDQKQWAHWIAFSTLLPKDYLEPIVSYQAASQRISIRIQAKDLDGDGTPDQNILPPLGPDQPISVQWETAGVLDPNTEMNDQGKILAPGKPLDLFAVVEPAVGRRVPVQLTVDGCRQAFLYDLACDRDRQQVERERSVRTVLIRAPQSGAAFLAPLDAISVDLHVDAPEDAFQQPADYVEVGIDTNGDRLLDGERTVRLTSDRLETVFLDEIRPGGLLRLASQVADLQVRLDPGGLRNMAVDILAHLNLQAISPQAPRSAESSVRVILDGAAPELRIALPDQPVNKGSPIAVSVQTLDLSGVEKLEVGFDLDGSSDFEEPEVPKVLRQPGGAKSWTTSLPSENLEPGRYRILVRATDRVGLSSSQFGQVTIAPPPATGTASPAMTSTIRGTVVLIDRPAAGITVRLEGTGFSAVSDSNGRFVFQKVPHGSYTLQAKGIALNKFREGSTQITLPAATEPAEIDLPVR